MRKRDAAQPRGAGAHEDDEMAAETLLGTSQRRAGGQ
jgi:hypothetical protein